MNYAYDTRGRLTGVTQGSGVTLRSLVYGYGTDGFVSTITDAQSRQTLYQRDAAHSGEAGPGQVPAAPQVKET